jgi:ectoine hydroxylase-related dioxygenase (phytanoyl-CoA dioxygenase family)
MDKQCAGSDDDSVNGESSSVNSRDNALCEMLGLPSLDSLGLVDGLDDNPDDCTSNDPARSSKMHRAWRLFGDHLHYQDEIRKRVTGFPTEYEKRGVARFDPSLSIPSSHLRQSAEKLVWSKKSESGTLVEAACVQRTYERIGHQRCLTRLEQFCDDSFPDWKSTADYVGACLSLALDTPMVLFKEKLNLKPPGGSGFAPHLDTPSLMQFDSSDAAAEHTPTEFVTVMVAIDNMTSRNGCLRVVPGPWTKDNAVRTTLASQMSSDVDNPDGGGRRGLIPADVADKLDFEDVVVEGGMMVAFSGYTPHRSSVNGSPFSRRAVFLTYNPASQGDHRQAYYSRMLQLRDAYKAKKGLSLPSYDDSQAELEALKSIPRI